MQLGEFHTVPTLVSFRIMNTPTVFLLAKFSLATCELRQWCNKDCVKGTRARPGLCKWV